MNPIPAEKRAQGPLVSFVDLLFLLVAFFTLLLFFVQQQRTEAVQELEQTQERLEALEPFMEQITTLRETQDKKRRREQERELRRAAKDRVRLEYHVLENGVIRYEGGSMTLERFLGEVLAPLRERHWVSLRGYSRPETPFGTVIETRSRLLRDQGEFDTYWDNVTRP